MEFMFILSDKNTFINKMELLDAYRELGKINQKKVIYLIKEYCDPKRFSGNKIEKKDFNNWKNQSSRYFNFIKNNNLFWSWS